MLGFGVLRSIGIPNATAWLATGFAAICSPLYPLTFWLHSDACFMLIVGAATWLAIQGPNRWSLAAVLLLVAISITIRWAGALFAVVILAAWVSKPQCRHQKMLGCVAILLVVACTFGFLRLYLSVNGENPQTGGSHTLATLATVSPTVGDESQAPDLFVRERPDLPIAVEYLLRIANVPSWFAWTLFVPLKFVADVGLAGGALNLVVGLLALIPLTVAAVSDGRKGNYLLAGVLAYVCAIAVVWPHVNNRYLVPVLPFVIAGIVVGLTRMAAWRYGTVFRGLRLAFIAAFLFVNGYMYAVDVWIARSPTALDFYARYEAGIHLPLIEAAAELEDLPDAVPGRVSVSERYENLGERWDYKHAQRVIAYIANLETIPVPRELTGAGVKKLQQWSRDQHIRYYVHQNPTIPGRLWHFRLTRDEHALIVGYRPGPHERPYELYEMVNHAPPGEPSMNWLDLRAVRPLHGEELERLARRVPHGGEVRKPE